MIVCYPDGTRVHAVIYRLAGGSMRAALAGLDDPVDFSLVGGTWVSEAGVGVTFEFPIDLGVEFFPAEPGKHAGEGPGTCVMGGDCVIRRMAESGGNFARN